MNAVVGDTLLFTYLSMHDVWLMADANATNACDFSTARQLADNNGSPFTYTFTAPGTYGFACATPGHCADGQRVIVNVAASAGMPPPPANGVIATKRQCVKLLGVYDSC